MLTSFATQTGVFWSREEEEEVMASCVQYVCWECMRDDGGYSPYAPEESYRIEQAYASNPKGKVAITDHIIDLANMRQERPEGIIYNNKLQLNDIMPMYIFSVDPSGYEYKSVKRRDVVLPTYPNITGYWLWCMQRPSTFTPYQVEALVDIEAAYLQWTRGGMNDLLNLANCPCKLPYTINFKLNNQTRHGYQTQRTIKRVSFGSGSCLQFYLQAQNNPAMTPMSSALSNKAGSSYSGTAFGSQYPSVSNYCGPAYNTSSCACHAISCTSCSGHSGHALYNTHMSSSASTSGPSLSIPQLSANLPYGSTSPYSPSQPHSMATAYGNSVLPPTTTATVTPDFLTNVPFVSVGSILPSSHHPSSSPYITHATFSPSTFKNDLMIEQLSSEDSKSPSNHHPSSSHSSSPHVMHVEAPPSTNRKSKSKSGKKTVAKGVGKGATPVVSNSNLKKKGPGRPRKKAEGASVSSLEVGVGGGTVGGGGVLMTYAKRVKRLKAKDDEVTTLLVWWSGQRGKQHLCDPHITISFLCMQQALSIMDVASWESCWKCNSKSYMGAIIMSLSCLPHTAMSYLHERSK